MKLLTSYRQQHSQESGDSKLGQFTMSARPASSVEPDKQTLVLAPVEAAATLDRHDDQQQQEQQMQHIHDTNNHRERISPIERFFEQRTIFITGSSGFMGKVLLEKLLRCYTNISHIYLLLRTKRNTSPHDRLHNNIFNAKLFDTIRGIDASLLSKVSVIPGDISLPRLGMSKEDEQRLVDANVSIIFHSAATVKFDEPLKKSVALNLIAAQNMIEFARKLPQLVSLCHVSTAYANSDIKGCDIEELVYPMMDEPKKIIEMAKWMDEDTMQMLKGKLLRNKPNTYTYTKALAELLLVEEAQDLPVTIVRPSIVVATWRDPIRGWVDNLNGPTGLLLAIGKGLLRTLHVKRSAVADIIPADVCINVMIAAAWKTAQQRGQLAQQCDAGQSNLTQNANKAELDSAIAKRIKHTDQIKEINIDIKANAIPVYHCTSGKLNPITWGMMELLFLPIIRLYPSAQVLRYPSGTFKESEFIDSFYRLFVHYLPALLGDLLCLCTGNKRILLNIYEKIHGAAHQLKVFCNNEWSFKSDNMMTLYRELDPKDRATLPMDISKVHWESYWHDYILGARSYVLKEDLKTLTKARKSLNRAYYVDLGLTFFMMLTVWYFLGSPILNICSRVFDQLCETTQHIFSEGNSLHPSSICLSTTGAGSKLLRRPLSTL